MGLPVQNALSDHRVSASGISVSEPGGQVKNGGGMVSLVRDTILVFDLF